MTLVGVSSLSQKAVLKQKQRSETFSGLVVHSSTLLYDWLEAYRSMPFGDYRNFF